MTKKVLRIFIVMFAIFVIIALAAIFHCIHMVGFDDLSARQTVEMIDDGIFLVGGYRFESYVGGELFSIFSSDGSEVVPAGAVMTVIKNAYCIGYYDQGAYYYHDGNKIELNKVFFVIYPNGIIHFHEPNSDDCRFGGARISKKIIFN